MILRATVVAALASLALAGCGGGDPTTLPTIDSPTAGQPAAVVANPTAVTIPAIDAHSTLQALGLDAQGGMAVPPVDQPWQASWYAGEHPDVDGDEWQPGEYGPAVIAGHVDGIVDGRKGSPGVFKRLGELTPGAEIIVNRDGADPLTFIVDRVEQHDKDALDPASDKYDPALVDAIYLGPTERPELRLVTCSGGFDHASGHYVSNTFVFAHLA